MQKNKKKTVERPRQPDACQNSTKTALTTDATADSSVLGKSYYGQG